jgi:hypothetical protein
LGTAWVGAFPTTSSLRLNVEIRLSCLHEPLCRE